MISLALDWNALVATPTQVGAVRKLFQMPTTLLAELECYGTPLNTGDSPPPPPRHQAVHRRLAPPACLPRRHSVGCAGRVPSRLGPRRLGARPAREAHDPSERVRAS